ncbi:DUF839 domain-containing protein [Pricia sp. S334]|uniref:DUF839 domain-containing protein n=1 Tax=Pricia mediterranea TaxID=3076079 RepID=A0ABU3L7X8_9FLAO|nr:alkaline phosphatase PhoX [Pricia sp. S334]MDT7829328.1 DUF839 domain-containing protein [Pricia sp. S334]
MNQQKANNSETGRRAFIKQSTLASLGFMAFAQRALYAKDTTLFTENASDYLKLVRDNQGYLDLPEGFSYKIISKAGQKMNDGFLVPGRPDAMGAFYGDTDNHVILVRNHENNPEPLEDSPFGKENELLRQIDPASLYDAGQMQKPSLGGTTTLVFNESTQEVERQHLSLAGTNRNCAGGITPWGSWLTCEEDVTTAEGSVEKDHGFVFEVPAIEQGLANPVPITGMGRFNHEAVAVDPNSGIVYETEDRHDGLIYRYIPNVKEKLLEGGRLQVLALKNRQSLDTRNWEGPLFPLNEPIEVEWLDIDDVVSPKDDLRFRGFEMGAARFARGEGMWYGENEIYFVCTNGGANKHGQIFRYRISPDEGNESTGTVPATLELFAESMDKNVLHMCDNLTIAPWGDLILCEDNGELNHLRGIKPDGTTYTFATNTSSTSEMAGAVFSPSGKTLFVNLQENGDTIAITGPWEDLS